MVRNTDLPLILLACVACVTAIDINPTADPRLGYCDNVNGQLPRITDQAIIDAFTKAKANVDARSALVKDLAKKGGIIPKGSMTAEARHQRFLSSSPEADKIDRDHQIFQNATEILAKQFGLSQDQVTCGLPALRLPNNDIINQAVQTCVSSFQVPPCDDTYPFRTADGSCNNLRDPLRGRSFMLFNRLVPPDYADAVGLPRVAKSGNPLPNPRIVSTTMHTDVNVPAMSYTLMTMQWAQFMDHDLTLTPMTRSEPNGDMIECCPIDGSPKHPACFPIAIPKDDYFFGPLGQTCLNFVRSALSGECTLGPRQQTNMLTTYIDASNVYGSTENETKSLRTFSNGLLKSQSSSTGAGELLPESIDQVNDQCSRQEGLKSCFHAGDERVNEQPGLTCMHTIWLRQHNRIAAKLKQVHPGDTDEQIFQKSRRIVGSQLQVITYKEFLPVVLGTQYMDYFGLELSNDYTYWDQNLYPNSVQEFSTACYRFGHTLINNIFPKINNAGSQTSALNLSENFFFPKSVFDGDLPSIVRGLYFSPAQQYDRHIVIAVTNNLYKQRGTPFGMDLPALNLQRGRDHGVRGYITYIYYCFNRKITEFSQLGYFMTTENWQKLQTLYEHVEDIDLFTGGVSEIPLTGAVVGPTFGCVIGIQFYRLRYGDRFWFEHGNNPVRYAPDQIVSLQTTTLASVICKNTDSTITKIKENVFWKGSTDIICSDTSDLNFGLF